MRATSVSLGLVVVVGLAVPSSVRGQLNTGPWNLAALQQAPQVTWVDQAGVLRRLYYQGEALRGKPTRVFAYYAQPAFVRAKLPGVVLVHGGGGTAYSAWALAWAKRGYAALAMDLDGLGPDGLPLPDGGPSLGSDLVMPAQPTALSDLWSYHAVAAVVRGVSVLRSLPQVNPLFISVYGISWGGYLTCIAAGLDARIRSAVTVYGCGFLADDSAWSASLANLPLPWRLVWLTAFDPMFYLPQARMPMLFLTDVNDSAYMLDSFQRSSQQVRVRQLCLVVNLAHSHQAAWARPEPALFIDANSLRGLPLPQLSLRPLVQLRAVPLPAVPPAVVINSRLRPSASTVLTTPGAPGGAVLTASVVAPYRSFTGIAGATVSWTFDGGPWQNRRWATAPALVRGGMVSAQLPTNAPLVYFLTLTDRRGASVTTEVQALGGK